MLLRNSFSASSPLIIDKAKKERLKQDIKKTVWEIFSGSKNINILQRLSFNEHFTDIISKIGDGQTIDGKSLVDLSLEISRKDKLKLSRTEIIDALTDFALNLLNCFEKKTPEIGRIPSGIQNFYDSMSRVSYLPDGFYNLFEKR